MTDRSQDVCHKLVRDITAAGKKRRRRGVWFSPLDRIIITDLSL